MFIIINIFVLHTILKYYNIILFNLKMNRNVSFANINAAIINPFAGDTYTYYLYIDPKIDICKFTKHINLSQNGTNYNLVTTDPCVKNYVREDQIIYIGHEKVSVISYEEDQIYHPLGKKIIIFTFNRNFKEYFIDSATPDKYFVFDRVLTPGIQPISKSIIDYNVINHDTEQKYNDHTDFLKEKEFLDNLKFLEIPEKLRILFSFVIINNDKNHLVIFYNRGIYLTKIIEYFFEKYNLNDYLKLIFGKFNEKYEEESSRGKLYFYNEIPYGYVPKDLNYVHILQDDYIDKHDFIDFLTNAFKRIDENKIMIRNYVEKKQDGTPSDDKLNTLIKDFFQPFNKL